LLSPLEFATRALHAYRGRHQLGLLAQLRFSPYQQEHKACQREHASASPRQHDEVSSEPAAFEVYLAVGKPPCLIATPPCWPAYHPPSPAHSSGSIGRMTRLRVRPYPDHGTRVPGRAASFLEVSEASGTFLSTGTCRAPHGQYQILAQVVVWRLRRSHVIPSRRRVSLEWLPACLCDE